MKLILACIYMRTLLEYEKNYLNSKLLTKIYYKIVKIELKLAKQNKAIYDQCTKIASHVWLNFKADADFKIMLEPYINNLYFNHKAEFIKHGFKPTIVDKMFDSYYNRHGSKLEVISRDFSEELMDETLKTIEGYLQ